jgi:hypothetical protein
VTVSSVGTEADLDGADVGLEATTNAGINTAGTTPSALAIPGDTSEHVTLVAKELLGVLLNDLRTAKRNRHLPIVSKERECTQLETGVCRA